jgi:chromate transporter
MADEGENATPPTIAELFRGFLILGLTGFGGVLPLARHMVVEQRKWLTPKEFSEILSLCQFLPGGNIINLSVAIGLHFRGVAGALSTLVGLIAAPMAVVLASGAIYGRYQSDPRVLHMFAGLAAAAAGQLITMAVRLALPLRQSPIGIAVGVAVFAAIAGFQLPLVPTMLAAAPASILLMLVVRA